MRLRARRARFIRFIIGAIMLLLAGTLFRGWVDISFSFLQRPLVTSGSWIYQRTAGWFLRPGEWQAKVQMLEQERNILAIDRIRFETLREENTELRRQLSFLERKKISAVTASILSRSTRPPSSVFRIDRGKEDGLFVGAPVVVGEGILIGKISEVSARSSTVTTIMDPASMTAVTLTNSTRTIGLTQGLNGTLIILKFIPHDQIITVNDLVATSGLEENVPSGLLVGIVNAVQSEKTDPFQSAIVEPLADPNRLHVVSVLLPKPL